MGAALYPVDPNVVATPAAKTERTTVSPFDRTPDTNLPRALALVNQLQAELSELVSEVRALRDTLARTEHKVGCQEQLLRNAVLRELELRAQLGDTMR